MKTDRLLAVSEQGETHQVLRMVPTGTMPIAFGKYEVQGHSMPSYYLIGGGRLVPGAIDGELVESGTGLRLTLLDLSTNHHAEAAFRTGQSA